MANDKHPSDRPFRIVAADDDPMIRRLLGSVLSRAGYDVTLAANGSEAIALTQEIIPDLVILDYVMPDIDGGRVAALLKAAAVSREIPVLLVSAMDDLPEAPAESADAPWSYRVQKPFTPKQLKAKIAEIIGHRRPQETMATREAREAPGPALVRPMRQSYVDALKETVSEMEAELAVAPSANGDAAVLESMRRKFHRIRGSAATFGFPLIGSVAAEAEALVCSWQGRLGSDAEIDLDGLRAAVGRIAELLRAAVPAAADSVGCSADDEPTTVASALLLHNDEAFAAEATALAAKRGYELEHLDSPATTLERLRERSFAIVTIGGHAALQPDCEWVRSIRQVSGKAALVLLGGDGSIEHRVTAARSGVDRYLAGKADVSELFAEWADLTETTSVGRVLVVDDDPTVLRFVETELRRAGCEVVCLDDAVHVFDRLEESDPDLLLLDVDMPSASGLEVAHAVRTSGRWEGLPIVIQTAHAGPEYRLRAFESGADDFLTKPIVEEELRTRVIGRLERERVKRDRAHRDPVTGFYGRAHLITLGGARCARRSGSALATVELEGLSALTRNHGLQVGETALEAVATELRAAFRSARDVIGRVAGDVLAVVVPGSRSEEVATRLGMCFDKLEHDPRLCPSGAPSDGVRLEASVVMLGENGDVSAALETALRARQPRGVGHVEIVGSGPEPAPTVYVIEDDEHLAELVAFAVSSSGYPVQAIASGSEAIHTLLHTPSASGNRPVVLLDVDLPDVDGFRVLEELKLERPHGFQVVMLTASESPGDRMRALRAGARDYIVKPVKIPALLRTLRRLIDGDLRASAPTIVAAL